MAGGLCLWGRLGLYPTRGPKSLVVQCMEVFRNLFRHDLPPFRLRLLILACPVPPDARSLSTPPTGGPMGSSGSAILSVPSTASGPGAPPLLCSGWASPVTLICTAPGHAAVERSATLLCLLHRARDMPNQSKEAKESSRLRILEIDADKVTRVVRAGLNDSHPSAAEEIHYGSAFQ